MHGGDRFAVTIDNNVTISYTRAPTFLRTFASERADGTAGCVKCGTTQRARRCSRRYRLIRFERSLAAHCGGWTASMPTRITAKLDGPLTPSDRAAAELRWALLIGLPLVLIAAGIGGAAWLESLKPGAASRPPERAVSTAEAIILQPRTDRVEIVGYGTTRAARVVTVAPEVNGRVVWVSPDLEVGAWIEADAPLMRIDRTDVESALASAQAEVAAAGAELDRLRSQEPFLEAQIATQQRTVELARADWERRSDTDDVTTVADRDAAELNYRSAQQSLTQLQMQLAMLPAQIKTQQAVVARAESAVTVNETNLARTEIAAPRAGQIVFADAEVGQVATPGVPIARIAATESYEIPVIVDQSELRLLDLFPPQALPKALEAAIAAQGGTDLPRGYPEARIVSSAWDYPGLGFDGRLVRIGAIDPATRTVPLIVEVDEPWRALTRDMPPLMTGTNCRVRILGRERDDLLIIPERALRADATVYRLVDGRRDGDLRVGKLAIDRVDVLQYGDGEVVIYPAEMPADLMLEFGSRGRSAAQMAAEVLEPAAATIRDALGDRLRDIYVYPRFEYGMISVDLTTVDLPADVELDGLAEAVRAILPERAVLRARQMPGVTPRVVQTRPVARRLAFWHGATIITSPVANPVAGTPIAVRGSTDPPAPAAPDAPSAAATPNGE
jgi:multidrug efflux pump subunit AcrA (membrane-fusion protein)